MTVDRAELGWLAGDRHGREVVRARCEVEHERRDVLQTKRIVALPVIGSAAAAGMSNDSS